MKSTRMEVKQAMKYVAIGQAAGGKPEAINSFDDIDDAASSAGEFVATHKGATGWVENIPVLMFPLAGLEVA